MVVVGDFCLMDIFLPGCPGDSFVFHESELAKLKKKEYHISTYWEEAPKSTSTKGETYKSPHTKKNVQKPSHKAKYSPQAKEQKDKCNHEDHNTPAKTKDQSHSDKGKKHSSEKDGSVI